MNMIGALYWNGLQVCLLERVPDNFALKSNIDSLLETKMDETVLYATNSSLIGKTYKGCDVTVENLVKWHAHLGRHFPCSAWSVLSDAASAPNCFCS